MVEERCDIIDVFALEVEVLVNNDVDALAFAGAELESFGGIPHICDGLAVTSRGALDFEGDTSLGCRSVATKDQGIAGEV